MNRFAQRLQELRKEQNLSYMKLSKKISATHGAIWQWEHDMIEPTLTNIYELCNFFNVTSDYLIGLTNIKNKLK